ncbi:hypothetical protein H072_4141 [Dactylellina haptotyla CBS 200.50]|uniref:Uncharacterized protein n=1 Tax=Dactylellina haptotyla (strain CBS 200.50) TaxID=1284197 RepID=S8C2P0_DACHA|nr:hypothetical protein H072_4141 [Dactylellina haptotyla CBS 200.50]
MSQGRACVAAEGGSPCSRQLIKDQVLEDVTEYLTTCAAAGLLDDGVKGCIDTARLNIDIGTGVIGGLGNLVGGTTNLLGLGGGGGSTQSSTSGSGTSTTNESGSGIANELTGFGDCLTSLLDNKLSIG